MIRSARSLRFVFVLVCALSACGPSDEPPPPAEETADASTVRLVIALDLPDTLQRAVEDWAAGHRARVEWASENEVESATLAEVEATRMHELVAAGALRPMPDDALTSQWLAAAGRVDGTAYGLPWRAELTTLAADSPVDWPGLARAGEGLVMVAGCELTTYVALAAASGVAIQPGETHDLDLRTAEGVEALSFLRRLAVRARRVPAGDAWPDDVRAALLTSEDRAALPAGLSVQGLPGPDVAGPRRSAARVRVLVVPVSGDHGDLGIELARWLAAPARSELLHARASDGLALHREVSGDENLAPWLELRPQACLTPTASVDASAWNDVLDEAVQAAVERRRAPRAALDEAWARR